MKDLVKPLARKHSSRFSRGRPPPRESRVRVEGKQQRDAKGRTFLAFAVDVRFGSGEWRADDMTGCVYAKTGEVFVKRGETYRPATFLLGKKADPVVGVCEGAPPARSRA